MLYKVVLVSAILYLYSYLAPPAPGMSGTALHCTEECLPVLQSSEAKTPVGWFCGAFVFAFDLSPLNQKKSLEQESGQSYEDLRLKAFQVPFWN